MENFWDNILSFILLALKVYITLFFIEAVFYFFDFDIHIPIVDWSVKYVAHLIKSI